MHVGSGSDELIHIEMRKLENTKTLDFSAALTAHRISNPTTKRDAK
jgi:electron transfer flavoprotein alpha/beta subunit